MAVAGILREQYNQEAEVPSDVMGLCVLTSLLDNILKEL